MPVLTGARTPPPADGGLVVPDVGYAFVTWHSPDGTVWPLDAQERGWETLTEGISGLDAAPVTLTTDKRHRGGVNVRHRRADERVITWPLDVFSEESHLQFVQRWRTLMLAFTQTTQQGPGWLRIARPDGSARQIQAYYQSGFEGKKGLGVLSDQAVITLLCEDPYWQDVVKTIITRRHATGTPFLDPFPTVSSGQVLGATTLTNPGDVEAWPDWTITGPASALTATLATTGESFELDATLTEHGALGAGEQATIQTRPMRVRGPAGEVWTDALNWPGTQLWRLPKGQHDVTFAVAGSGPGTQVELAFYPRYESA